MGDALYYNLHNLVDSWIQFSTIILTGLQQISLIL